MNVGQLGRLVWRDWTLERAPSLDSELRQLNGFERVELEVGGEDVCIEAD